MVLAIRSRKLRLAAIVLVRQPIAQHVTCEDWVHNTSLPSQRRRASTPDHQKRCVIATVPRLQQRGILKAAGNVVHLIHEVLDSCASLREMSRDVAECSFDQTTILHRGQLILRGSIVRVVHVFCHVDADASPCRYPDAATCRARPLPALGPTGAMEPS